MQNRFSGFKSERLRKAQRAYRLIDSMCNSFNLLQLWRERGHLIHGVAGNHAERSRLLLLLETVMLVELLCARRHHRGYNNNNVTSPHLLLNSTA